MPRGGATRESALKSAKTRRERYGPDFDKENARLGGLRRGRGYFGKLKDEGRLKELKRIAAQGGGRSAKNAAQEK